ncbi:MAG: 7-cyano-7-deazaguanine synthase QueC [Steroidobacteraceae bacterium]
MSLAAEDREAAGAPAVVLVSGGLDSATVLAIARERGHRCHALSFDYGQRHRAELDASRHIASALHAVQHRVLALPIGEFGHSALTDAAIPVPEQPADGIPATYVPARNTILLACALAHAEVIGARHIYVGVNAVDYSGYPDCRPEFIRAFERMANLATRAAVEGRTVRIHAPLIEMSKADIIRRGIALGIDYSITVSCYQPDQEGRACGRCESCRLRRAGFEQAGVADPTRYQ